MKQSKPNNSLGTLVFRSKSLDKNQRGMTLTFDRLAMT